MKESESFSLILIRGLPGSGKTKFAELVSEKGRYSVFSIDQYFTDQNGNYIFDHSRNHLAYDQCIQNVRSEMQAKSEKIFVDNTFTLDWEMEPYLKIAKEFNYAIYVLTVENYHGNKNIHGVSDEQLKKMAAKYTVKLLPDLP